MTKENEKEVLLKIQLNHLVQYLIKVYKCTYQQAMEKILGSDTYHRLIRSETYLNQGANYILQDFKHELA